MAAVERSFSSWFACSSDWFCVWIVVAARRSLEALRCACLR